MLLRNCSLPNRIYIVFVMGGEWPYSCCFVECCLHALFNIARSILLLLSSSFLSIRLVSVHVVHPYRQTRHAGHCWRCKDELRSDVLLWTPTQKQDDQLEPTYNSSVLIRGVALNTNWKLWMIEKGGVAGSGRSAQVARYDGNDDDDIYRMRKQNYQYSIIIINDFIVKQV